MRRPPGTALHYRHPTRLYVTICTSVRQWLSAVVICVGLAVVVATDVLELTHATVI